MEVLNIIIIWCNENQGFIMTLLTFVYVVATVFIYVANNKSAKATERTLKQNSTIQKQNIDIQLFNDRFDLFNTIKNSIQDKHNSIKHPFDILNDIELKGNSYKDIEICILRVKYLFTDECHNQLLKVIDIINELSSLCGDIDHIYELLDKEGGFVNEIKAFVTGYEQDQITVEQEETFKRLCDERELYVAIIPNEHKHYNYYEMYKNIGQLEVKLRKDECVLFKLLESKLYIEFV